MTGTGGQLAAALNDAALLAQYLVEEGILDADEDQGDEADEG